MTVTLPFLAECARAAEDGNAGRAAEVLLRRAGDADVETVEALMRYALVDQADVDRFHDEGSEVCCIRVPRLGEFWLAPLECWTQLPSGATVISPRGLRSLGRALVDTVVA